MSDEQGDGDTGFFADAHIFIVAASHADAQGQLEEWVAEHMPKNFVISWTLTRYEQGVWP